MQSTLSDDTEKDVIPWLKLAEELRILQLDMEVSRYIRIMKFVSEMVRYLSTAKHAANLRYGRSIIRQI